MCRNTPNGCNKYGRVKEVSFWFRNRHPTCRDGVHQRIMTRNDDRRVGDEGAASVVTVV